MTVPGIVRGLKEYGAFVELTPNLSGLAERKSGLREGPVCPSTSRLSCLSG